MKKPVRLRVFGPRPIDEQGELYRRPPWLLAGLLAAAVAAWLARF